VDRGVSVGGGNGGAPARLKQFLLVAFEAAVDEEGAEGKEAGDKDEGGAFDGPLRLAPGETEEEAVCEEESAVDRAEDMDRERLAPDAFQGYGDAKQDEEGDALQKSDEAEATDFVSKHGAAMWRRNCVWRGEIGAVGDLPSRCASGC
jgi:hypothetical protein